MALTTEDKASLVTDYGTKPGDTGSAPVQIALLTERIRYLTEHLKTHKKDHASRRGLLKLVGQRRKLSRYMQKKSPEAYEELRKRLGLRR